MEYQLPHRASIHRPRAKEHLTSEPAPANLPATAAAASAQPEAQPQPQIPSGQAPLTPAPQPTTTRVQAVPANPAAAESQPAVTPQSPLNTPTVVQPSVPAALIAPITIPDAPVPTLPAAAPKKLDEKSTGRPTEKPVKAAPVIPETLLTAPITTPAVPQTDQPAPSTAMADARHQAILQQAVQQAKPSEAGTLPLDPILDVRLQEKPVESLTDSVATDGMTAPRFVLKPAVAAETTSALPTARNGSQAPAQQPQTGAVPQPSFGGGPQLPPPTLQQSALQQSTYAHDAPRDSTPATLSQPVLPHEPAENTQPLRSFSLQFSPEGSKDVRLHVSQQSGDVHISVHSNDAALSNKLRDGVQDLVGHLSNAGYEADARTNPDGGRRQQQEREPETYKRRKNSDEDSKQFEQMLPISTEDL